jgi:hypothetical protein
LKGGGRNIAYEKKILASVLILWTERQEDSKILNGGRMEILYKGTIEY